MKREFGLFTFSRFFATCQGAVNSSPTMFQTFDEIKIQFQQKNLQHRNGAFILACSRRLKQL